MESFRIGEIEEILINAFPAVEREIYDGWILNFSGGYTYRANCSNHFLYNKGVEVRDLDDLLEKKGYPVVKYVDVLYRSLEDWNGDLWTDLGQDYEIITMSRMDEEWLDGVNQLIDIPFSSLEKVQKKIFGRICLPMVCVKIRCRGRVIGTGLGVMERHYIGLYAIHVHKDYRQKGLAMKICGNIMTRGKSMGADKAHLQVRQGNTGAFALYEKLGMKKIYTQWFRMKSWPESRKIFD